MRSSAEKAGAMSMLTFLLYLAGAFAVVLGFLHFTFPTRFGLLQALATEGPPLPPFRMMFYRYDMKRSDLRGIVCVMNHCVSYVILMIGVFDLFAPRWLGTFPGSLTSGAIAGFWLMRGATQLYLGRRKGDWFVVMWFVSLATLHLVAAAQ
jgi:hypothetical protein